MAKITPTSTAGGYNLAAINANIQAIADELNNKVLYRTNPAGEPNQMNNNLDMNGKDILNGGHISATGISINGDDLTDDLNNAVGAAAASAVSAANSAIAAAGSASSAAGSVSTIQTLFLGSFSSDPITAAEGALYYNSTVLELRYRRSGVWVPFPQANAVARQFFVGGVDFTAGTTTVLTLPATSYTKNILWLYFDGSYVQPNRYTLTDQTHVTFTAPITAGTTRIEIGYITPLASLVIDDNSLTTAKYQDQSVTTPKIADGAVTTVKLANANVTTAKIANLAITTPLIADTAVTTAKIVDSAITAAKLSTTDVGNINQKLGVALVVDSIASLKALTSTQLGNYSWFDVSGYYAGIDGGGGRYVITGDTTTPVNNGTIIANTATGRRFYLVQQTAPTIAQFGAKMDGVTDDSAAVQSMTQLANLPFTVPTNKTLVIGSATTIATRVTFEQGASILANVTVNLQIKPIADPAQLILKGSGPYSLIGNQFDECPADWFYSTNLGPAINNAWKFSKVVTLNQRSYSLATSATPPAQTQGLVLTGKGFRASAITVAAGGVVGVNYQRVAGQAASSLDITNIEFQESGLGKTSTAILWRGAATGVEGSETAFYDDNWMRVRKCIFIGFSRCIDTKYCGQCYFEDNYYQANAICHFMARDSSFFYMTNEMALDNTFVNGSYIFQQDATNDARSNGLTVTDCHSVLSDGIDVNLQNYQLAQFKGCTFDLGNGGAAAMYINNCQDIHMTDGWIACSATGRAAGRVGVFYQSSRHCTFSQNTFNGCSIGFEGNGGSSVSILDNVFDNCAVFDITDIASAIGYYVAGNKHKNTVSGATISIGGASSKSNIVVNNIMTQASYAIPVGTNAINSPNVYSAGFPI
jgi:hypothetical protein